MNDYLLIDGTQIPVLSELAQVIGLNGAIVLQEVYYWCKVNKREKRPTHDGYYWVYNSYREWRENHFPWWNVDTVRGTFTKLEKSGLLISGNFNKSKMDRTKWYRINFDVLAKKISSSPLVKNSLMDMGGITQPIPDIIPERNENGAFSPQAAKSTCSFSGQDYSCDIDLLAFIEWYYTLYSKLVGVAHPKIRPQQKQHVIEELSSFLADPEFAGVDFEGLQDMAKDFFSTVDSNDWRIHHFATQGILRNRYYNVYCHS